jgi:hypothetical protein
MKSVPFLSRLLSSGLSQPAKEHTYTGPTPWFQSTRPAWGGVKRGVEGAGRSSEVVVRWLIPDAETVPSQTPFLSLNPRHRVSDLSDLFFQHLPEPEIFLSALNPSRM